MMADIKISELRKRYGKEGVVDDELPEHPVKLFKRWFDEAVKSDVTEPNAMALATVTESGTPNVRMVLLKGIRDHSITFFTNFESRKGEELRANPVAACTFWWGELERQVRISGKVQKLTEAESEDYFRSRPRDFQIGAWASDQSRPVENREALIENYKALEKKFEGKEIPKPDYWGGFEILLQSLEFWQGRPARMHDRILYQHSAGKWNRQRLAP